MSTAIVSNRIRVLEPSSNMFDWARKNLILDNPDYYKRLKMGKWVGGTAAKIFLYEKMQDELWLPFGCLLEFYREFKSVCAFRLAIAPQKHVKYVSDIKLFDYQEKAAEDAIKAKNGVIVMSCGSGKTQTALEIVSRIGGRCLWLTHTADLLNQSMARAKSVLQTSASYGKITAGKVDIGEGITFATVQTMCKLDLAQYKSAWDVVIVDECQHCCGSPTKVTQFYKVVNSLSARYKFGLTATPKRADGLEKAMFALLGGVIHVTTKDQVAHTTCPVRVRKVKTGWMPDYDCVLMGDGTIDYNKVIDAMIHDSARFGMVIQYVVDMQGATMVLANRVEYLQNLCMAAENHGKRCVCISGQGQSKKAKAERKAALEALNNGEIDCIFCTYSLAAEGLDVPNLRYIVFATPEKNDVTVTQATGRVGRKAEGKEYGTVIDFVDDFGMYKGFYKKRLKVYKKLNYDIIE